MDTKLWCSDEEFDYVYEKPTEYYENQFRYLDTYVQSGSVLDIGAGPIGDYWSLGYLKKATSISYSDRRTSFLDQISHRVQMLSGEELSAHYGPTLSFLRKAGLLEESVDEIAAALIEKIKETFPYDFLSSEPLKTSYDNVVAIQSIETVSDELELERAFQNMYRLLSPGGRFVGVIVRYRIKTEKIKYCIEHKMEGLLNPNLDQIKQALDKTGFRTIHIQLQERLYNTHYPEAIYFAADRGLSSGS